MFCAAHFPSLLKKFHVFGCYFSARNNVCIKYWEGKHFGISGVNRRGGGGGLGLKFFHMVFTRLILVVVFRSSLGVAKIFMIDPKFSNNINIIHMRREDILREDFLEFVPMTGATGEGLAITSKTSLSSFNLNLQYLVAQSYDGAAAMSGKFNGFATKFLEEYPQTVYIHCCSHPLNLVVSDSSSI